MDAILAIMRKDLTLLLQDRVALFFTFVFPLVFAFFFGSMYSQNSVTGLDVAVIDADATAESQAFVQQLDAADEFTVTVTTEPEAREWVRTGKRVAFIIVPSGFGKKYASVFGGQAPEIIVGIDPARRAEAGYMSGSLMKLGMQRFQLAFSNLDNFTGQLDSALDLVGESEDLSPAWRSFWNENIPRAKALMEEGAGEVDPGTAPSLTGAEGANPMTPLVVTQTNVLRAGNRPRNAFEITIAQGAIWAIMGCVIGFAVSVVQEKTLGTINRLAIAPISRWQILAGKALGCFAAQAGVISLLFIIASVFLGVEFHLPKLIIAVLASGTCFVGIMMLFASLAKTERAAGGMTNGFMIIAGMAGGAMIPLFSMPDWLRAVSHFSPVKWSILALEGAIWRDFSYMELLTPVAVLVLVGVVTFWLSTRLLKLE